MYRLLKENLDNYKRINNYEDNKDEYRMRIIKDIEILVDKQKYEKLKKLNNEEIKRVENLVYEIGQRKANHKFNLLAYEFWGYGYESYRFDKANKEETNEQLKLIEMFAKNVYWF
ncbi:MAG TPA: hypothetical protein DCP90_05460 [Clostridiales bacterium]|nr:MAG: hypothetical protein A2Y22_05595 [Clostridiales bacterium GWD2_32_59]HAN10048.1 hypothetical protein [Clostridiales bacterium]